MVVLALLVLWARNRFDWFLPKFERDRMYVVKQAPASQPLSPTDFIELNQSATKLLPVHIRVYADGRIDRDTVTTAFGHTTGCPLEANRAIKVAPEEAKRVIETARSQGFYALSSSYAAPVVDLGTSVLTLSVNGQEKSVSDHAGDPPPLFWELVDSIRKLSPMEEFIYPWRFSAERKAACAEFRARGQKR